jgi:hypothetical protein
MEKYINLMILSVINVRTLWSLLLLGPPSGLFLSSSYKYLISSLLVPHSCYTSCRKMFYTNDGGELLFKLISHTSSIQVKIEILCGGGIPHNQCSVPTKVFADLLLSLVITAHRTCRVNTRTALLEMYVLTGRGH